MNYCSSYLNKKLYLKSDFTGKEKEIKKCHKSVKIASCVFLKYDIFFKS